VREAVAALPRRQRAVIVLRFFADLSVREVSELLGCPEGTVKTLSARALAVLRATDLAELKEATDAQ
jgi:RNA polymerase sigma factor (sigma-70 family)